MNLQKYLQYIILKQVGSKAVWSPSIFESTGVPNKNMCNLKIRQCIFNPHHLVKMHRKMHVVKNDST